MRSVAGICDKILDSFYSNQALKDYAEVNFGTDSFSVLLGQREDNLQEGRCVVALAKIEDWLRDQHRHAAKLVFSVSTQKELTPPKEYDVVGGFWEHIEFVELLLDSLAKMNMKFSSVTANIAESWPLYVTKITVAIEFNKPTFGG